MGSAVVIALMAGCASGPNANPQDPLEPFNRDVSAFNESVDSMVLKPVATVYRDVTPDLVRTGVSNFFSNLGDVWSFINASLQLRPREASENFLRFGVNTAFGLGGVLDIASEMGIERTRLDFGQTLGYWGVGSGPYVMLPLMGPSTLRDAPSKYVDSYTGMYRYIDHVPTRNSIFGLNIVDTRASLLSSEKLISGDKYTFIRNAYLQNREFKVKDGQVEDDF